jgi:hypothetical protein
MKCPGQDMQYWTEEAIFEVKCPECETMVEFYKDDTTRKCHKCQHRFVNPKMDFGCATHCQFAEQCLGTLPEEFVMQQDNLLKDKVAVAMKRYFKTDFKSIGTATKIARHAEKLGKETEGANLALILCSAYLHNIGSTEVNNKYGEITDEYLQQEGPSIAKEILQSLGANEELTEGVCRIISHKPPSSQNHELSHHIVYDAHILVSLEDNQKNSPLSQSELEEQISQSFHTENGRLLAREIMKCACE